MEATLGSHRFSREHHIRCGGRNRSYTSLLGSGQVDCGTNITICRTRRTVVRHRFATPKRSLIRIVPRRQTARDHCSMAARLKRTASRPNRKSKKPALGALPEWNLADLYRAMDAPEVKQDLDRSDAECLGFE